MKRIKKNSLTELAAEYYGNSLSERHRRRLFNKELERHFGHHLPLKKRIERKGYYDRKPLTPAMLEVIKERLGEP